MNPTSLNKKGSFKHYTGLVESKVTSIKEMSARGESAVYIARQIRVPVDKVIAIIKESKQCAQQ